MANFENGVKGYVRARATVEVLFPIDFKDNEDVCCRQCYYFRSASKSCALNGQICAYPDKYTGAWCPLTREEQ